MERERDMERDMNTAPKRSLIHNCYIDRYLRYIYIMHGVVFWGVFGVFWENGMLR